MFIFLKFVQLETNIYPMLGLKFGNQHGRINKETVNSLGVLHYVTKWFYWRFFFLRLKMRLTPFISTCWDYYRRAIPVRIKTWLASEQEPHKETPSWLTFRPCPSQHPRRLWSLRTRQKRSQEGSAPPRRSAEARSSWTHAPAHPSPHHCPGHPRTPCSPRNSATSKTSRICNLDELQQLKPRYLQSNSKSLPLAEIVCSPWCLISNSRPHSHTSHFARRHGTSSKMGQVDNRTI